MWDAFTLSLGKKALKVTNTTKISQLGDAVYKKFQAKEFTEGWVILEFEDRKIWAMPNDTVFSKQRPVPGWTIMFPEDY